MHNQEDGFGFMGLLLVALVLTVFGVGGYLVWNKIKDNSHDVSSIQATIEPDDSSSESSAEPVSETDGWLLYTSAEKTYTVRIPDGWNMLTMNDTENLYGGRSSPLAYSPGTKAIVTKTEGGWDGPSSFMLYVPGDRSSEIVKQGSKQTEFTTDSGLVAGKYIYKQTTVDDGPTYQQGDTVVNYYFSVAGKYIQVQHVYGNGVSDQTSLVEKMLKTLEVN